MTLRELGRSVGGSVLRRVGRAAGSVQERRPIPADLLESDDAFLAVFDAAGATSSDVQVRFSRGTVHVRIDRFRDPQDDFEMRFPGRGLSLDGTVDLPADVAVDPDSASATLTDAGALEVLVPKVESSADNSDAGSDDTETTDADAADA
ncbi:Molecular chaperone IbpA, HSP20 family [Natronoarchaeum philippinense]|uniref:Molecular chaperone IbpA, HSP20 family n=1 Tax=Natronoarchaeum philippinense TaxID=558529 RepID=A0A285P6I1_NATPI|nr:Hsp20/alpha crystallin family protein [Natronoarchaeum philippinense]SNZ17369.1 Molecular chaperone IbpA, HSP20 family [Natronoarchaeum philippinense]